MQVWVSWVSLGFPAVDPLPIHGYMGIFLPRIFVRKGIGHAKAWEGRQNPLHPLHALSSLPVTFCILSANACKQ